ncbi:MAG TPA: histidine phosphatase family protein [Reyranella sp.]
MVAPTRLTWICHAATAATRQAAFPGDEVIEDRQHAAAHALASEIGAHDRIFVAPERRTRQTAEALGLAASVDPDLRDCDYGRWSGRSLADLSEAEPDALSAWLAEPDVAPPGGESVADTIRRMAAWLDRHAGDATRLVAVSHPAVIRAAVVHVLEAPATSFWRIGVAPLGLVRLSHDGRRWTLMAGSRSRAP